MLFTKSHGLSITRCSVGLRQRPKWPDDVHRAVILDRPL